MGGSKGRLGIGCVQLEASPLQCLVRQKTPVFIIKCIFFGPAGTLFSEMTSFNAPRSFTYVTNDYMLIGLETRSKRKHLQSLDVSLGVDL